MPLLLAQAGAILRQSGHQVDLIEWGALAVKNRFDRVATDAAMGGRVARSSPDLIILDVPFDNYGPLIPVARAARAAAPAARIIALGAYPTALPEETLRECPDLDAVIVSDPEPAVMGLARGDGLSSIPSLCLRFGDGFSRTTPALVDDLDTLPFPAWDLYDMDYFTQRGSRLIPCIPIRGATVQTSRGCGGACTFCTEGRLYHPRFRAHSADYVAGLLTKLVRDYGVDGVIFRDEMFLGDADHAAALCERMIRDGLAAKLKWTAQVRTDAVTPDILQLMRRAGCVQLEFGIETGSDRLLARLAKGLTVETNILALEIARRAGIRSMADLMFGMPDETAQDVDLTIQFIQRTDPDMIRLNPFIPFPGTAASQKLVRDGRLPANIWSLRGPHATSHAVKNVNLSAMTDAELRRAGRNLYYRFVLPRMVKDLIRQRALVPFITSCRPVPMAAFLRRKAFPYKSTRAA